MEKAPTPRINEACIGCGFLELCLDALERRRDKTDEHALWRQMRAASPVARHTLSEQIAVHRDSHTAQEDAGAVISLEAHTRHCPGIVEGDNVVGLYPESNCGNNVSNQVQMVAPLHGELRTDPNFREVENRLRARAEPYRH